LEIIVDKMTKKIYRAITVKQPFAELILNGSKPIETRKGKTNIRERILIHSSKKPDLFACRQLGIDPNSLMNGYLLGFVDVTNSFEFRNKQHFDDLKDLHKSPYEYFKGIHGWTLKNPSKIQPVPYKGSQGWFKVPFRD